MTHGALAAETQAHMSDASAGRVQYAPAALSKEVAGKGLSRGLEDRWTKGIGTTRLSII